MQRRVGVNVGLNIVFPGMCPSICCACLQENGGHGCLRESVREQACLCIVCAQRSVLNQTIFDTIVPFPGFSLLFWLAIIAAVICEFVASCWRLALFEDQSWDNVIPPTFHASVQPCTSLSLLSRLLRNVLFGLPAPAHKTIRLIGTELKACPKVFCALRRSHMQRAQYWLRVEHAHQFLHPDPLIPFGADDRLGSAGVPFSPSFSNVARC